MAFQGSLIKLQELCLPPQPFTILLLRQDLTVTWMAWNSLTEVYLSAIQGMHYYT